jgi:GntR family transcriptional repressor for pyruvate dehydrogenase complex
MARSTTSAFEKVRSTRAYERIVEQFQTLILTGKLAPGARLPSERALMSEFQVSRPTVREALRVAESMGLISIRHGDPGGPMVLGAPSIGITRVFDGLLEAGSASALELLEMRMVLDSSAAALASVQPRGRVTNAGKVLQQMQNTTDREALAELDVAFHEAVIMASGNRLFHLVFQALEEPIRRLMKSSIASSHSQTRQETLRQHGAILDAVRNGDPQGAAAMARSHLREFYFRGLSAAEKARIKSFMQAMGTESGS